MQSPPCGGGKTQAMRRLRHRVPIHPHPQLFFHSLFSDFMSAASSPSRTRAEHSSVTFRHVAAPRLTPASCVSTHRRSAFPLSALYFASARQYPVLRRSMSRTIQRLPCPVPLSTRAPGWSCTAALIVMSNGYGVVSACVYFDACTFYLLACCPLFFVDVVVRARRCR